jgi:mono/diheme cytochrome c family protein
MKSKLGSVDVGRMVAFVRAFAGGKQVVAEEPEPPLSPSETMPDRGVRAGSPPGAGAPIPSPATAEDPRLREGRGLFQRFCIRCHGADGKGSGIRDTLPSIPDFTRHDWQAGRSDPQLLASVHGGKGTAMPAFGNTLGREQVRAVVAYIRGFGPDRLGVARTGTDDFEVRFEQLRQEIEELRRQFHALSDPPRSP